MPIISAASHHLSFPAIAFKITSCTFIIRSISADETVCLGSTTPGSHPRQADRSHANNTPSAEALTALAIRNKIPAKSMGEGISMLNRLLATLLFAGLPAFAQFSSAIQGTVTDQS